MAELVDMKFSLYESLYLYGLCQVENSVQTAFGELTKTQMLKSIKPPTHQQMSVPVCELRYNNSNIFRTHDVRQ